MHICHWRSANKIRNFWYQASKIYKQWLGLTALTNDIWKTTMIQVQNSKLNKDLEYKSLSEVTKIKSPQICLKFVNLSFQRQQEVKPVKLNAEQLVCSFTRETVSQKTRFRNLKIFRQLQKCHHLFTDTTNKNHKTKKCY